jgi:hypothetical protein
MVFWNGRAADAANLRLFNPNLGWRKYEDKADADGRTAFFGANRDVELSLATALNASNLLLLTGAGASFCARNSQGAASAPGMTDLWDAVEAKVTVSAMAQVIALIPTASGIGKNIEKLLTLCKLYVSLFADAKSIQVQAFIEAAEKAILERVDFVDATTDLSSHRSVVRKIARRGIRKPRTKIFTTNYDLCFEYAAQGQQFVVVDGFSHSTPQVYDRAHFSYDTVRRGGPDDAPDYIENVFHLYKLHGSLDWRRGPSSISRSRSEVDGSPVLIFPRDTKYQEAFEMPYLDMMGAFQTALREPDTALIVSGFGFKDDHISKPIIAAIEANMGLRIVLCDIAFISEATLEADLDIVPKSAPSMFANTYFERVISIAEQGDTRLTLLNGRFEDLALAVPDLVAQTERERHVERMMAARTMVDGAFS